MSTADDLPQQLANLAEFAETVNAAVAAGDSTAQREAEGVALRLLAQQLGVELTPEPIKLKGHRVEVDGIGRGADGIPILVECWAHQGPPKPAQKNKVLTDVLKLVYVEATLGVAHRKIVCFTDAAARQPFIGTGWGAAAIRHFCVELYVVELPHEVRDSVVAAQKRQYR